MKPRPMTHRAWDGGAVTDIFRRTRKVTSVCGIRVPAERIDNRHPPTCVACRAILREEALDILRALAS